MNYETLGSAPYDENCVQVITGENYLPKMREECNKYKLMLIKRFPIPENMAVFFSLKENQHNFGTYLEVAITFDENNPKSKEFMLFVDNNLPAKWDDDKILKFVPDKDSEEN